MAMQPNSWYTVITDQVEEPVQLTVQSAPGSGEIDWQIDLPAIYGSLPIAVGTDADEAARVALRVAIPRLRRWADAMDEVLAKMQQDLKEGAE